MFDYLPCCIKRADLNVGFLLMFLDPILRVLLLLNFYVGMSLIFGGLVLAKNVSSRQ